VFISAFSHGGFQDQVFISAFSSVIHTVDPWLEPAIVYAAPIAASPHIRSPHVSAAAP
jgi:hypothetical protein